MIDTNFKKFSVLILLCMILVYLNIQDKKQKLLGGADIDLIKGTVFGTTSSQKIFDKIILCRQHLADYEKKSKEHLECSKKENKDCTSLKQEADNFNKKHLDCLYKNSVEYKNKLFSIWKKEKDIALDISEFLPVNKDTIAVNKPIKVLNEKGGTEKIIPVSEVNTFRVQENKDTYKNLGILTLKSNKTVKWIIEPITDNNDESPPDITDNNDESPPDITDNNVELPPDITDNNVESSSSTDTSKKKLGDHDYFKIVYNSITGNEDLLKRTILFE